MDNDLKALIKELYAFSKSQLGLKEPIKIILKQDKENAKDSLGKTAYFDPERKEIVLYITNRHNKDVARSLSHEMVHAYQHQNGQMKNDRFGVGENYFQKNKYMRELEREAFEKGNMIFRDFEENKKSAKRD